MSKSLGRDVDLLAGTTREPSAQLLGDQNRRWWAGEHVAVEDYFATAPWLRSDTESLLDLIYNEIRLRDEQGETPNLQEYLRRFPNLADALAVQFEGGRHPAAGAVRRPRQSRSRLSGPEPIVGRRARN